MWSSAKTTSWYMEQQRINRRNECLQSRVGYAKNFFTINEKESNSKPVSSVSFLGYSVSKEGVAPDSKHDEKIKSAKPPSNIKQLDSFVGLANFNCRMIPNSASKMLPQRNSKRIQMGKGRAKMLLNTSKASYVLTLLYSLSA